MRKLLLKIQVAVLAVGTAFSWFTLVIDYRRFFAAGGRVLELSGCAAANPLMTPCFYGETVATHRVDHAILQSGRSARKARPA
jgi:hypothetical protein